MPRTRHYSYLIALILFIPAWVHAIPESRLMLDFDQAFSYYQSHAQVGHFTGVGKKRIAYSVIEAENEKGALVLVNGRTETFAKYIELMYDLRHSGFSIYTLDHRGQGFSERLLPDPEVGFVTRFQDYVDDLSIFMNTVVRTRVHPKLFVLSHSMGGAITALYLEQHPELAGEITGAVFSAPMLDIDTGKYPSLLALDLATVLTWVGRGDNYAPGRGDFATTWSINDVSHSDTRFHITLNLFSLFPETRLGGPSARWVRESLRASRLAIKQGKRISIPVLLLQAGDDRLVHPQGQDRFCAALLNCQKVVYPKAFHELLMEKDDIRQMVFHDMSQFMGLSY